MLNAAKRDAAIERAILTVLESPVPGFSLNSLRLELEARAIGVGHGCLQETLLAMWGDGMVRRTPNTCLWSLA